MKLFVNSFASIGALENKNSYGVVLFIAFFLSSMLGAQLFGISLNKIALIPLEISLLLKHRSFIFFVNTIKRNMLFWYFAFFISSLLGFRISTSLNGYYSGLILNIIQVFLFYIPLLLLITDVQNLKQGLSKAIIMTARIQATWGIAQFISLHLLSVDLNQLVFIDILNGALGTQWVAWYFDGITSHLRITGLNHDPAYLALILILGFCYEKNKIWRVVYSIVITMASSRSGILCISVLWVAMMVKGRGVTAKQFLNGTVAVFFTILGICFLFYKIPSLQQQVVLLINRFTEISLINDDGSSRHILYYITALEIWFTEFGLIGKIFGIGPRAGGVAITMSELSQRFTLNNYMLSNAWVIECDFAEILLGNGLLGLSLLYLIYLKIFRNSLREEKMAIAGIFIIGLMYDVVNTTLIQLFVICCIGLISQSKLSQNKSNNIPTLYIKGFNIQS